MFHISEKLTYEPIQRDATIRRLANILATVMKAAQCEGASFSHDSAIVSIRRDIYKLSMQIKQGIPYDTHYDTDASRLELLHDILFALPTGGIPLGVTHDRTNEETTELQVFPELDGAIVDSSMSAVNALIDRTANLHPVSVSEHKIMRARLHILALLSACILVTRITGHQDVFNDAYKRQLMRDYQTVKVAYAW